ncbi:MAG: iron-sulfur cluster assembly scaffold protein [Sphingomonadaceae bacterium]
MSSAAKLYTPQVLALAASLARFPLSDELPLRGQARSATCGSAIELGLALNADGAVGEAGLRAHACAIGQAAAAIFAEGVAGQNEQAIRTAHAGIETWLAGGELPDWPGFESIAAARDYPARHGAILLAWRAALAAFDTRG